MMVNYIHTMQISSYIPFLQPKLFLILPPGLLLWRAIQDDHVQQAVYIISISVSKTIVVVHGWRDSFDFSTKPY
jgi:hypothetical protein